MVPRQLTVCSQCFNPRTAHCFGQPSQKSWRASVAKTPPLTTHSRVRLHKASLVSVFIALSERTDRQLGLNVPQSERAVLYLICWSRCFRRPKLSNFTGHHRRAMSTNRTNERARTFRLSIGTHNPYLSSTGYIVSYPMSRPEDSRTIPHLPLHGETSRKPTSAQSSIDFNCRPSFRPNCRLHLHRSAARSRFPVVTIATGWVGRISTGPPSATA